jgi:hypothetical protein
MSVIIRGRVGRASGIWRIRGYWDLAVTFAPQRRGNYGASEVSCCAIVSARAFVKVQWWILLPTNIRGHRTGAAGKMRFKHRGLTMLKLLTAMGASLAMLSAAAAADLPRKEPPPPAPPVGKAPIGKYPVGKAPIGKYPQPVVTKG